MLFNTLGFAGFGLGVRAFQLGLQKRPVASGKFASNPIRHGCSESIFPAPFAAGPVAYLLSAAGFGAFGYLADGWEHSQREMIAEKQGLLRQRREERNAAAATA